MPIVESNKYPTWSNGESNYVNFPGRQGEHLYKIPKITNNGIWDWNGEDHTRNIWLS